MIMICRSFSRSLSTFALSAAAALTAGTLAVHATTVTWNFNSPTGTLGSTEVYTPVYSPAGPNTPTITAYGYEEQATSGGSSSYNSTNSYGPKATALYGKQSSTGGENGLGISGDNSNEIDYVQTVTTESTNWGWQTIVKDFQSFVQIDLSGLIQTFGNYRDATITIGSLQNPDTAVLSYSSTLGHIGTKITTVSYKSATNAVGSATISLSDFSASDPYLTISSAAPSDANTNTYGFYWCNGGSPSNYTSSVLLGSLSIAYTSGTPTPEPTGAALLGFAAMGLLLIPRRRSAK